MSLIKPEQYMTAYNDKLGIVYASRKGVVKTTTPQHAKAIEGCLEQYLENRMAVSDREKLEQYMDKAFGDLEDLSIVECPDLLDRKVLRRVELLVVNDCNLNCKYCYAHGGSYGMKARKMFPGEAEMYLRSLLAGRYRYIEIVTFFGGEPTLCPDTVRHVCEFFEKSVQDGTFEKMPIFLMVSNGTLIDEKMAEIIRKFNIGVTISVDGPKEINDLLRVDAAGNGSFAKVSRGIDCLNKAGSAPIMIEATYTAKHKEMGYSKEDIRKYLSEYFHIKNVLVADCTSGGTDEQFAYTDWEVHPGENGEMLVNDIRYARDCLTRNFISPIGCDAGFGSVLLTPDGDIFPCHSFVGYPDYRIAYFREGKFHFCEYENVMEKFKHIGKFSNSRCSDCWAKAVCLSCPAQQLLEKDEECIEANCHTRREAQRYSILKCAEQTINR